MHYRSGAHGAGLHGDVEVAVGKSIVAHHKTGLSECHDFGMSGGIMCEHGAVTSAPNDAAVMHDDGSHRDFSSGLGALTFAQRFLHPELVRSKVF
jgi:hypothetical protein